MCIRDSFYSPCTQKRTQNTNYVERAKIRKKNKKHGHSVTHCSPAVSRAAMRERSSHTTISNTVHSAIYNTLTETCDSVESLGGPFRNTFKEYNTNNGTPVCRFLSCIVTSQAQLVRFPAFSAISTDPRDILLQSLRPPHSWHPRSSRRPPNCASL